MIIERKPAGSAKVLYKQRKELIDALIRRAKGKGRRSIKMFVIRLKHFEYWAMYHDPRLDDYRVMTQRTKKQMSKNLGV
jgi:hypothetical protein